MCLFTSFLGGFVVNCVVLCSVVLLLGLVCFVLLWFVLFCVRVCCLGLLRFGVA